MTVVKPPTPLVPLLTSPSAPRPWIFLAGSIEGGTAEPWQAAVESALTDAHGTVLNPRRDAWDSTWEQTKDNPLFREQVEWELFGQERADLVAMYFQPGTKAPITLLELGLCAGRQPLVLCCPQGFWRKGNVDLVAERYGIRQAATLQEMIDVIGYVSLRSFGIGEGNER